MRRARVRVPDRQALARLARAAQQDDAPALDALLAAIRPSFALFFARRLARDVAEDLTQVALIRTSELVGAMQAERLVQHMSTIARDLLREERDRFRRECRVPTMHAEIMESAVDLERQAELDDMVRVVSAASARLLTPELQTIVMGVLCDRTLAEIAADTGMDLITIRMRLSRVRAILRRELLHFDR